MFFCLSSGATPRYAQNVLHALAQPIGSRLDFRYDSAIIAEGVKNLIKENKAIGQRCLIAHLNNEDTAVLPEILPCRFAILEGLKSAGSTYVLTFTLEKFAYAENLGDFQADARSHFTGAIVDRLPERHNSELQGAFWCHTSENIPRVKATVDETDWEKIVSQIAARPAFKHQTCFYMVEGIYSIGQRAFSLFGREWKWPSGSNKIEKVSHIEGTYTLDPGRDYELRLYHYFPISFPIMFQGSPEPNTTQPGRPLDKFQKPTTLIVKSSNNTLKFWTNPELSIDSPYDIKVVRFRTAQPTADNRTFLSLLHKDYGQDKADLDFDLLVRVKSATLSHVAVGVIVGISLALPPIVEAFTKSHSGGAAKTEGTSPWPVAVLYLVMYIIAGLVAAFKIPKPLSE